MEAINWIRNILKKMLERVRNEKVRYNILQAIPFWIASLITGLIAVLYAKLFAQTESLYNYILGLDIWWIVLLAPVTFVLAYFVVERFARFARGSGIPQVMTALELPSTASDQKLTKLVGIRVMLVKISSSLLMILGGAVIGREGPTIQVASSVFKKVNQWIPASWPKISKRTMIMTGAAAGLAAAFNTPLGGIVFAVEELTSTHIRYFRTAIFSAVIISGLTAQGFLGPYLYLGYPNVSNLSVYIFGGVILVSVITGLLGSMMCVAMLRLLKWKKTFSRQQNYYYVIAAALIIALFAFINHDATGSGKELMNGLLFKNNKYQHWYMPFLRIVGSVTSFTTGAAGGVFAPALASGASIGALLSQEMHLTITDTNLLILGGMVGFLTGVTRTPFTSAILVLEMTDRHSVIFYLMLAGMVASTVAILVDKHSFYDHLKHQYTEALDEEDENAKSLALLKTETVSESEGPVTSVNNNT